MAVKAVAYILPVGNPFYDPIFFAELLYLKAAEIFGGSSVDRIKISVLLLIFTDLLIDML